MCGLDCEGRKVGGFSGADTLVAFLWGEEGNLVVVVCQDAAEFSGLVLPCLSLLLCTAKILGVNGGFYWGKIDSAKEIQKKGLGIGST
jgi:hypothetical protein